jgi:hypothetical protein
MGEDYSKIKLPRRKFKIVTTEEKTNVSNDAKILKAQSNHFEYKAKKNGDLKILNPKNKGNISNKYNPKNADGSFLHNPLKSVPILFHGINN